MPSLCGKVIIVTFVFITTAAAGFLLVLAACRMDQVAWKFVRLIAILAMAALASVLTHFVVHRGWTLGSWAQVSAGATAAGAIATFFVLGLAPVAPRMALAVRGLAAAGGTAGLIAAWGWGFNYGLWSAGEGRLLLSAALIAQALSAWLLGSVALATALGHAYLTQTSMPIAPLRRLANFFLFAMILRTLWAVLAGGGLVLLMANKDSAVPSALQQDTLMLVVRGGIGLAVPLIFAIMVRATAKLRATQSATGILYFAMVLIAIGELTALHLVSTVGIPF